MKKLLHTCPVLFGILFILHFALIFFVNLLSDEKTSSMKKLLISFSLFIFHFSFCIAQINLVPNFSFEQYSACPTMEDQIQFSDGWSKYSNSISTPDYYNACVPSNGWGDIPQNTGFYQPDHRNCGAYMGLVVMSTVWTNYREQIGIQLNQTLVIGQKYYLSFYTVMAGTFSPGYYYESPANNIGLRLSTFAYNPSNTAPIDNFAHLRSVSVISDTTNWVRISGSIVADSAYDFLILGNFYDDANTDTTTLNCGICLNWYSYYLIDDVCVSTDSLLCNGGIDALPCNVSVNENIFESNINIYPNPANNSINISNNNYQTSLNITIYNTIGQQLYVKQNINTDNLQIDISNYNTGLLFIKIESNNQQFTYKLLKQ